MKSAQLKGSKKSVRETASSTEKSKKSTSPKKLTVKDDKPKSETNVLKIKGRGQKTDSITYTKSTDYVDHEGAIAGDMDDCYYRSDELTPRTTEKIRGIARMMLRHTTPCSIRRSRDSPSEDIEGIRGKAIGDKEPKYTEPLYHQMIERNSISAKEGLQVLEDMNRLNFINRHLDNVELLSRGIDQRKSQEQDYERGDNTRYRKQLFETMKKKHGKNVDRNRPKSKKSSVSSVKAMKQLAVSMVLRYCDLDANFVSVHCSRVRF